jgi:hypothetical protein
MAPLCSRSLVKRRHEREQMRPVIERGGAAMAALLENDVQTIQ